MRILIYSTYFPPVQVGNGKYAGEMASWLSARGHEIRVVTAPPFYPAWKVMDGYSGAHYRRERWQGIQLWRCPIWVPRRQTGLKRILHLLSYTLSSTPVMLRQVFWKPDVVFLMTPPIFCALPAILTARMAAARSWLHLQDFEVDVAFETGLLHRPALRRAAVWIERQLMRGFDRVSTISRNMLSRLAAKGVADENCVLFPNWVDSEEIRPLAGRNTFRDKLGLADEVTVALYSGSMGEKQGLETVLDAARSLTGEPSLRFVMCGEGATRKRLIEEYRDLKNVIWLPLQPVEVLNDLLNLADIHLLPQRVDVADLVMPSKLTGMLASGRPVVATAMRGTQVDEVVKRCGIVVPPGDAQALGAAILRLAKENDERLRLGDAARNYAVNHISATSILSEFERTLISCTAEQ